jgi:DNA modification methylase
MRLLHGDCLEVMHDIPDGSVDMILADLPYGTTACKWDTIIPPEPLWAHYKRVIKRNGAIVLNSNPSWFKYALVWDKCKGGNIFLAKHQPMKTHEDVLVFSGGKPAYNPQMEPRDGIKRSRNYGTGEAFGGDRTPEPTIYEYTHTYPKSILTISNAGQTGKQHPTQKPVALMEYLIRTYTNDGETVLDNTMGSGTTGVACVNTNRDFIGIEQDAGYYAIACKRIEEAQTKARQMELITA